MGQGKYTIIERLDAGGMAEVFKGKALSISGIEKIVAIKRILPSLTRNEKFVRMFLDEARVAMSLNHANIVQTFDVGFSGDSYFLVMEYVEGTNLKKLNEIAARTGRRIPVEVGTFVAMEVCKALAHAHEKRDRSGRLIGIVHRDVSPPNILLSLDGEVKLTDFGLAKARTQAEITDPGVVKGKFAYLCPEAVDGQTVDHRADIFSLGIVLWETLAGRRLFLGDTDRETLALVRRCNVPSPREANPAVPPELDSVVLRALARDPRQRYQDARTFGADLAGVLFSRGLRVTAYDLAALVRSFLADLTPEPGPRPLSLIDRLIVEELEKFRSLGTSGSGPVTSSGVYDGSKPLTAADLSSPNEELGDLAAALEAFGPGGGRPPRADGGPGGAPAGAAGRLSHSGPGGPGAFGGESAGRPRRRWRVGLLLVGVGLLVAAAVAALLVLAGGTGPVR